jgi:hypothetical protein
MEEYEREMKEMKDRINRRPLLFEQESQVNYHLSYNSILYVLTHHTYTCWKYFLARGIPDASSAPN